MTTPTVLLIDHDDPMFIGYMDLDYPVGWRIEIGDRAPLSVVYNLVFAQWPDLDWYGIFADDVVPQTPGWDRMLIDAAGLDGVAYGDDGIDTTQATHFVLGGNLARSLGWLALPGLARTHIDSVWNDIATERGVLRFVRNVRVSHLHFSNRRALMDQTYRKPNKQQDRVIYEKWRQQ